MTPGSTTPDAAPITTDVLIVGGGPSGASIGTWLARAGHDVTIVEKRAVGRHKSCGDTLTPRALAELARLGIDPVPLGGHVLRGVRMSHASNSATVPWPEHRRLPAFAAVLRRDLLDEHLRACAIEAGARVLMGHEASAPLADRGFVRGASITLDDGATRNIHSRFLVVADGAHSRFGRVLGTSRKPKWPYGIATRTYFESTRSSEEWSEAALGLPDPNGNPIAGYGWITPMGNGPSGRGPNGQGMLNVGVGVLSSYRDIKGLNTLKLLDSFVDRMADTWQFDASKPLKVPTRLRLPMGGSVGPKMGPTFLVVGDAGGAANPFNGDGVDAALMGGRIAAEVLSEALTTGNSTTLQRYPVMLADEIGQYHKVGRLSARFLGRPAILKPALKLAIRNDAAMGAALRIATNELRDNSATGGAERAYKLAVLIARFAPSW